MSKTSRNLRAFSWGKFSWTEMICVKKLTLCNSAQSLYITFVWHIFISGDACLIGRYDFGLFLNFITGKQGLLCVTETWRYGYIRDYGDRVETPHGTTIGCE